MLLLGLRRSPDMLAPTAMPVTAGKKSANMDQKLSPSVKFGAIAGVIVISHPPAKKEPIAATRAASTTNWMRRAKSAPTKAMRPKRSTITVATTLKGSPAKVGTSKSTIVNPMT